MDEFDGSSFGEPNFSFRAPDEDELLIAALEGGLMPSDAEDIRMEWNPPPCPECLRLDNWYLGSECNS